MEPQRITLRSNIMSTCFTANMRTQSWKLNLVAAVIATSTIVIASAQEPQKQLPERPVESAQGDQQESKKKEDDVIICDFGILLTTINVSVTDGNNQRIPDL